MTVFKSRGFTLIESIVAIVVLGISMTVLVTALYPRIENSASAHYQVRASALAQSMMTEVLSRQFDKNSDQNGGMYRCDEAEYIAMKLAKEGDEDKGRCTPADEFGSDSQVVADFDDVDDYIGCWYTNTTSQAACSVTPQRSLSDVLGTDISNRYPNFRIEISVVYDNAAGLTAGQPAGKNVFKRITLTVYPGKYGSYRFVAHKGNY